MVFFIIFLFFLILTDFKKSFLHTIGIFFFHLILIRHEASNKIILLSQRLVSNSSYHYSQSTTINPTACGPRGAVGRTVGRSNGRSNGERRRRFTVWSRQFTSFTDRAQLRVLHLSTVPVQLYFGIPTQVL